MEDGADPEFRDPHLNFPLSEAALKVFHLNSYLIGPFLSCVTPTHLSTAWSRSKSSKLKWKDSPTQSCI